MALLSHTTGSSHTGALPLSTPMTLKKEERNKDMRIRTNTKGMK
jgi:hypothetical protein